MIANKLPEVIHLLYEGLSISKLGLSIPSPVEHADLVTTMYSQLQFGKFFEYSRTAKTSVVTFFSN